MDVTTLRLLGHAAQTEETRYVAGTLDLLVLNTLRRGPPARLGIRRAHPTNLRPMRSAWREGSLYQPFTGWSRPDGLPRMARRPIGDGHHLRLTRTGHKRLSEEQEKWDRLTQAVGQGASL